MTTTIIPRAPYASTIVVLGDNDTAMSAEATVLKTKRRDSVIHYEQPISRQRVYPPIRFHSLKTQWEAETAILSSITEIVTHPAYQQIIGMGRVATPLILAEMKKKPGHWFWALKSITGEDPVLPEQKGKIKEMTEAWLRWGREQGILYE